MNRRLFHRTLLGALGAAALDPGSLLSTPRPPLRVNGQRISRQLAALAEFGKNPQGGVSRVAYGEADRQGREYVLGLMRAARLETRVDAAGNLIGRRAGTDPELPPLMFGSHIDSVPEGGNYDGTVGSIGAIEVARTLAGHAITTRHPLEVVVFQNEEGGKTGSRAISGELEEKELELLTHSRKTIREGIRFIGGDPDRLESVRRSTGAVAAYLELHIEQGGVLEREKLPIGVVEGIVGIKRWEITVDGFANHAGTTPMDQRQDALLAAARLVEAIHRVVTGTPGRQVGTVGRIHASPGAPNVIPGQVVMSLELRDLDPDKVERLYERMAVEAGRIGEASGTRFSFKQTYVSHAAPTDERLRSIVEDSARDLGLGSMRMPSGAGHDAQSIARFAPVGMIFIPSVGGISHSPREFSRAEEIEAGVNVLLHALLALDATVLS